MNKLMKGVLALPVIAVASPALAAGATGPDFTALTDAITFDTTITAILSVGGLAVGVALAVLGARKVLRMIKGA